VNKESKANSNYIYNKYQCTMDQEL